MANKFYTKEHIDYLKKISPGRNSKTIVEMFNKHFNLNKTLSAINTLRKRNGILANDKGKATVYKKEHIEYIKEIAKGKTNIEIAELFNKKFNMNKSALAMGSLKNKQSIYSFEIPEEYTKEQIEYLREITNNRSSKKITDMYNKKFGENRTKLGIRSVMDKNGIFNGRDTKFKKGLFSPNRVVIGSERITKDGYIQIKVRDGHQQKNWRGKHIIEWEKINGPLPEKHAIIFGDGDNRNFDINNLVCVSRKQLLGLNRYDLIQNDAELTRTAVNIVDLNYKISERSK